MGTLSLRQHQVAGLGIEGPDLARPDKAGVLDALRVDVGTLRIDRGDQHNLDDAPAARDGIRDCSLNNA